MSDAHNGAREFVGEGRDEAISKACVFFGVDDASELTISGYEPGAIYGLATRTVIVAIPKGSGRPAPARSRDDEGRGRSGRGAGRDSNRGRDRGRDDRGRESSAAPRESREPRGNRERTPKPEASRNDRDRNDRDRNDRDNNDRDNNDRESNDRDDRTESAVESTGRSVGDKLGEIGEFMLGTIERMGLGSFEISESREGEMIVLQVRGDASHALSSGQGRTVDALQLLVNQVSARISPDRQRVVLDVEGNADAREEFLGKLAERVAKRALQTGRPVALDPMNGRDRRLIHVALRDREDVATMSEGEGRYRQVVVVPESSDEFEDAQAKSQRADDND